MAALACAVLAAASPAAANNVDGAWSPVTPWPLIAVHAVLMPDGRVLSYGTKANGQQTAIDIYDVWDPSEGLNAGHTTLPNTSGTDIFCSSQLVLPAGSQVFIAGGDNWTGTSTTNTGNNNSNLFSYADGNESICAAGRHEPRALVLLLDHAAERRDLHPGRVRRGTDRPEVRETRTATSGC